MYVCMYVCMYWCMYWCMYVCKYVCRYVCRYVCMYVCVCVHVYAYIYVGACVQNCSLVQPTRAVHQELVMRTNACKCRPVLQNMPSSGVGTNFMAIGATKTSTGSPS